MFSIDTKNLKRLLDQSVKEDIQQFGKPAIVYNYHHATNKFNTMDTPEQWLLEQQTLKAQGLTMKPVQKEIEINNITWNCILWVFQPFKKNNTTIDEKKYYRLTNHMLDPLGLSVGYMVSGFCYLALINKK